MLIAIQLTLESESDVTLPSHLGRANYAETLRRLGEADESLAARIHDGNGPKPITCSGLLNAPFNREDTVIEKGKPYYARITGLTQEVSQLIESTLLATPPDRWELDHHVLRVSEVVCDAESNPWTGRTGYAELASAQVSAARLERRVAMRFASPTAFKSGGMTAPVPLPGLVFGSLVDRWNAFSPIELNPETRRFGEEMIAISRYKLQSRPVRQKNGALRMGGVGEVTYAALGADRYWLGVMHMLAAYALYSGVGVQTTTGMGQTCCLK